MTRARHRQKLRRACLIIKTLDTMNYNVVGKFVLFRAGYTRLLEWTELELAEFMKFSE